MFDFRNNTVVGPSCAPAFLLRLDASVWPCLRSLGLQENQPEQEPPSLLPMVCADPWRPSPVLSSTEPGAEDGSIPSPSRSRPIYPRFYTHWLLKETNAIFSQTSAEAGTSPRLRFNVPSKQTDGTSAIIYANADVFTLKLAHETGAGLKM